MPQSRHFPTFVGKMWANPRAFFGVSTPSIGRHQFKESSCTINDRSCCGNGLIDVVDTRRRAVEVGILRRVAEPPHPVEFTNFNLPWWLELSDRHFKQNGVCTLAAGFQPLIDQTRVRRPCLRSKSTSDLPRSQRLIMGFPHEVQGSRSDARSVCARTGPCWRPPTRPC